MRSSIDPTSASATAEVETDERPGPLSSAKMNALYLAGLWLLQTFTLPQPVGYVNDFAQILDAGTKARIEAVANDVKAKSGGEIVVVTLSSLGGRPIEEIGLRIGREWKVGASGNVGDRARNAGTIILVAPNERSMRIEVGSGAEGFLNDARTGAIQDEALPYFRANNYPAGIELMALRVAERYATEFNFTLAPTTQLPPAPQPRARRTRDDGINPVVLFIIFMIIVSMMGGRRGRGGRLPIFIPMGGGRYHGGGGFGGGGFGGGGGGFGGFGGGGGFSGGGSSRGW
jgi:uncharacterized protein